jgi:hypothetical protein
MAELCTHLATESTSVVTLCLQQAHPSSIPTKIPVAGISDIALLTPVLPGNRHG